MLKKAILIGAGVVVASSLILFLIPWGSYESTIEKTALTTPNNNRPEAEKMTSPSLDDLEGSYTADEKAAAEILFTTKGLKDTKGGFEAFDISLHIPDDFRKSELHVKIATESINTGNAMRDKHLREEEFFDVENYPEISFVSTAIDLGDTAYTTEGMLTMNGTNHPLILPFKHLGGGEKNGVAFEAFEGAFAIDRTAYGQEASSGVGDEVTVSFYCELEKK